MKLNRRAAALYLGLTLVVVLLSHVSFVREDNGMLLNIDGKRYDLIGSLADFHARITSNCSSVIDVAPTDARFDPTREAIRAFSPPDSASARIASLRQHGQWLLAEVEFDALLPAVVLLREDGGRIRIEERAIWSGTTQPWNAAPLIRNYLGRQAPSAPAALLSCFTPRSAAFR